MSGVALANLTVPESDWLQHMGMFGSDAYPVQKAGRGWLWTECWGVKGAPVVYKTKRACRPTANCRLDAYSLSE